MPVRELITVPDDTLRKISEPLNKVELNEKKLIKIILMLLRKWLKKVNKIHIPHSIFTLYSFKYI